MQITFYSHGKTISKPSKKPSFSHVKDHILAMEKTINMAQRKDNIMLDETQKEKGDISNKELYIRDEKVHV